MNTNNLQPTGIKEQHWKVEGMSCATCVHTVTHYLKNEGLNNVKVSLLDGDVSFTTVEGFNEQKLINGIEALGYRVKTPSMEHQATQTKWLNTHKQRFLFCLVFTFPLWLHMFIELHWLMNPLVQLSLTLPVVIVGVRYFVRSAWRSIRNRMPNMNVLISMGAGAAFVYSILGLFSQHPDQYLFFETAATIITLVFMGEFLEERSIASTQVALNALISRQKVMANMIAFDDQYKEQIFPIENTQLRVGDLILIRTGEQVPADAKILWGDCLVNESIITGESTPVSKKAKDLLIGGSILENGNAKAQVTAKQEDSVLSGIVNMVKKAQGEKPPVQKLADRISALFVPMVVGIALLTFLLNFSVGHQNFAASLTRTIAVLVIACPCAMGLATPAAIAVGMGRGARNGILFRNASVLEAFRNIQQIVFDKTGTLTTGKLEVARFETVGNTINRDEFIRIAVSMEKYSTHPIAAAVLQQWKSHLATHQLKEISWTSINEIRGLGMKGTDREGNHYEMGSFKIMQTINGHREHSIYLTKNNEWVGWIDLKDELRPEAQNVVNYFHQRGISTWLVSGDSKEKCNAVAAALGIDKVYAEQTPEEKLNIIDQLNHNAPTAMVGDGINDGPALAKATIGISMSEASQLAVQSADVVLIGKDLKQLPMALALGKHTFRTIQTNLFWAFIYNIIAIPVAAFGFLTPNIGALAMGLSDIVLALNSSRLFFKKLI